VWFPSEGYYDMGSMQGARKPQISGRVKIETNAYLFQTVKIEFNYEDLNTEVNIELNGLGRNDMPMRFPLGAGASAVVSGFSLEEGNSQILPISSEPTYAGTDKTGLLVIEKYDKEKREISGYFEFTCQRASSNHKARGVFKNIPLKKVDW
jgi:hypothetical protein